MHKLILSFSNGLVGKKMQVVKIQEEFRVKKLAKAVTAIQFQLLFYCLLLFQCLCIAPTYELALQIGKNVEDMGKFMKDLQIIYAVRGERCKSQPVKSNSSSNQWCALLYMNTIFLYCSGQRNKTKWPFNHRNPWDSL